MSGATLSDDLERFKSVVNGRFSLTIGGDVKKVDGLSFARLADFNAVATKIQEKLTTLSVAVSIAYDETGNRFIVSANVAGEDKKPKLITPLMKVEKVNISAHCLS